MASKQVVLASNTPSAVPLDAPTGRVVVTLVAGATPVWVTSDGTGPVDESSTEVTGTQTTLSAVVGAQVVVSPSMNSYPMAVPTIQLMSAGPATVLVQW